MIHTAQNMKSYKEQLKEALANRFLRTTLGNFGTAYRESRAKAFEGIDFEELRQAIAAGKDQSLPRLMDLFATFKTNASTRDSMSRRSEMVSRRLGSGIRQRWRAAG